MLCLGLGIVLAVSSAAWSQPVLDGKSALGSYETAKVHEIQGLPPVDLSPGPELAIDRPEYPPERDPLYVPRPSPVQQDLGDTIDAPPLERTFPGFSDTGWKPPDPIIAAGPSHLVACVNSHIAYFNKTTGQRIFQTSTGSFFKPLSVSGYKIFDPWVVYDEYDRRFIILFAATLETSQSNLNLLAISKTASPLNGWWLYKHDFGLNGSTPSHLWGDYPKLATDRNAIYITGNMANWPNGTLPGYAKIRVLQNKADMLAGKPVQLWWDWWDIRLSGSTSIATTIQPCHDYDSKSTTAPAYFCCSFNGTSSAIYFFGLTDVTNRSPGPNRYASYVSVGSYAYPGNAEQQGGSTRVENVAPRLLNAVKRNGSIWTAHSIKRDATSCYLRWYEFRVNSWPTSGSITTRQESSYYAPSYWYYFPAITVNKHDDVAIVFNRSGASEYVGVRWTGRKATDPLSTLQGSAQLKAGEAYYVRLVNNRNRWGDYSGCAAAPDGSIWMMGEYAVPNNKWATWIGQVWRKDPEYWISSIGGTYGKSLLGMDSGGSIITSITLPGAGAPGSVCMGPNNYRVLVFDYKTIYRYYLTTGILYSSALPAVGNISWGGTDEAGYIFFADMTGRLYRGTGIYGSSVTTVRYTSGANYNAVAWNGETGQYVAVTFSGNIHFIARDGTLVRNVAGPTSLSGIDFDPYSGYLYITRFGGTGRSLVRLTQTGSWSYFGPSNSAYLDTANSVECQDQPNDRLIGTEYGGDPQHVWRANPYPSGSTYRIHASNGLFGPSDLAKNRQRSLWSTGRFRIGTTSYLNLRFGPDHAGDDYRVATALGYRPGFDLSVGHVHLSTGDPFFIISLLGLDGGTVWKNFAGVLDDDGQALPSPRVLIPNMAALRGIRFYYAAIAYSALEGVKACSNMCGVTIE